MLITDPDPGDQFILDPAGSGFRILLGLFCGQ
jgi:hypothetical protein